MANRKIAPKPKPRNNPNRACGRICAAHRELLELRDVLDAMPARLLNVMVPPTDLDDFEALADSIICARSHLAVALETLNTIDGGRTVRHG